MSLLLNMCKYSFSNSYCSENSCTPCVSFLPLDSHLTPNYDGLWIILLSVVVRKASDISAAWVI